MKDIAEKSSGISKKNVARLIIALMLAAAAGCAYFLADRQYKVESSAILEQEEAALRGWADGTAESIRLWKEALISQVKRVSSSELYRLFATEALSLDAAQARKLNETQEGDSSSSMAEQVPLMRNVLLDFMNLNGFTDARIMGADGLTLLSAQARPIPLDAASSSVASQAIRNGKTAYAPVMPTASGLQMYFADPLKGILNQQEEGKTVAAFLAATPVTGALAQFLARDSQKTDAVPLILQFNALGDGQNSGAAGMANSADNASDSAGNAAGNIGYYEILSVDTAVPRRLETPLALLEDGTLPFAQRPSINGRGDVWSLGVPVRDLNWQIVMEAPAGRIQENLRAAAFQVYGLALTLFLGLVLLTALLWWILVGREQKAVAEHFKRLYQLIGDQKRLLDNVNAALDTGLLVMDTKGSVLMANRAFGELCSCNQKTLPGENIAPLFEPAFTHGLLTGTAKVVEENVLFTQEFSVALKGELRLLRLTFFPFRDQSEGESSLLSLPEEEEENIKAHQSMKNPAALITFTDITAFRRQAEQRRKIQENTMYALVRAVESMDPYLYGHSRRMEQLGGLLSRQMNLSDDDRNTVALAATLSQIGKLFIPRELLNKTTPLTEAEKEMLLSIPEKAWETLMDVDFSLPIPEALHDMYERLDGTGYPRHLTAGDIPIHARILAVLNSFCAMTAPRSYRAGMDISKALEILQADSNGFDAAVVAALQMVLATPEGAELAGKREK